MMPYEFSSVAARLVAQRVSACLIRIDLAMNLACCETKIERPDHTSGSN
jgi:hypothetical protein